jgi:hypothetical protein
MSGYSVRQYFPTPAPSIVSFGGLPVERVGTPMYAVKQLTEGTEPLFATKWEVDYFIPREIYGSVLNSISGNAFVNDRFL